MLNDGSGTSVIKKLAFSFLKENIDKEVPLRLIRSYINNRTGKEFSHGMYSSAMRDLVEESEGRILNTERGYYKYVSSVKKGEINDILGRCIKDLENAGYVNFLSVNQTDLDYIKEIPNLVKNIEKLKLK